MRADIADLGATARSGAARTIVAKGGADAPARFYGVVALIGASVFVGSLIALHAVRADIDWVTHYVSDFANGRFGWLLVFGAAVHGIGNAGLSIGLWRALGPGRLNAWGALLLGVSAVGIVMGGVFPIDPAGQPATWTGVAHRAIVAGAFAVETLALFLLNRAFARSASWRDAAARGRVFATVAALTLAGLLVAVQQQTAQGLAERAALAAFMSWEVWAAIVLTWPHRFMKSQGKEAPLRDVGSSRVGGGFR